MKGRPKGIKNRVTHIWTKEERELLAKVTPGHHYKEIQEILNSRIDSNFSLSQIKAAIKRYNLKTGFTGQFQKGSEPTNKGTKGLTGANRTSFKKGDIPKNHRPVGSERINVEGYTEIKVAEPSKWRLKHRVVWEKANGQIPKGYTIIFGDGDKRNLNIKNLILISRSQLLIMNRNNLIKDNVELTKTGIIIADLYKKMSDNQKKVSE